EQNRRWLGAGILGAAGLVRETSIITALALVPPIKPARGWLLGCLAASICVLPAVIWAAALYVHFGTLSKGALDLPLVGLLKELRSISGTGRPFARRNEVYVILSTLTQA